jgi:hypothetical protein
VCAFLHVLFFTNYFVQSELLILKTDFPPSQNVSAGLRATSWKMYLLRIGNIKIAKRFRLFGNENGGINGALCGPRKDYCRELPINRCAGLASTRLSSIAAAVLLGLEAGWRTGGVDQCRDGTTSRNLEIPKSPVRWGLG